MRNKYTLFAIGLCCGLSVILLLGAAEMYHVRLTGEFEKICAYQSTFSGINNNGDCYLAVTDTKSGQTEIFALKKELRATMTDKPFQLSKQGSMIVELTMK